MVTNLQAIQLFMSTDKPIGLLIPFGILGRSIGTIGNITVERNGHHSASKVSSLKYNPKRRKPRDPAG